MQGFEVVFYEKEDGSSPVEEFLQGLDAPMEAKMLRTIELLENNGHNLREPYSKAIGDGIFELRAKVSSDITRVLFFFAKGRQIVLTNGFVKKTDKTPKSEIDRAQKFRAEYLSREEG